MLMIEKLYDEVFDGDRPENPDYDEATRGIDLILKRLDFELTNEQLNLVKQLQAYTYQINNIECKEAFKKGFAVGQTLRDEADAIIKKTE